jgi:hypothetical protein
MTATELAALIVAISSVVAVVLLAVALVSITKTLREVRTAAELLRTETLPVMLDLADTVQAANAELERVDGLLGTAESITGTVDSAGAVGLHGLISSTASNPVARIRSAPARKSHM